MLTVTIVLALLTLLVATESDSHDVDPPAAGRDGPGN